MYVSPTAAGMPSDRDVPRELHGLAHDRPSVPPYFQSFMSGTSGYEGMREPASYNRPIVFAKDRPCVRIG